MEGNPDGIPVVVLGLEKSPTGASSGGTKVFADRTGLELVVDDSDHEVIAQFFPSDRYLAGGSDFVALNGVPDSPSHKLWEIIYLRTHYSEPFRNAVSSMRRVINAVEAPTLASRELKLLNPRLKYERFQFEVEGPPDQAIKIQYSIDGVQWTELQEITLGETPFSVVDNQFPLKTHRFYRAVIR